MEQTTEIPIEDIFNHMPLDHLIGISLLIATLIGMVLMFSWKIVREILKRRKD